jgi:multiple sugar transport system ATP-binding protein
MVVVQAADNAWTLSVDVIEQHGSNTYVHCSPQLGGGVLLHLPGQSTLAAGDVVHVRPAPGRWHLFGADEQRLVPSGAAS